MSYYIHPTLETIDALQDHVIKPEDKKKLLHVEAMLHELLDNVRKEIVRKNLADSSAEGA